MTGLSIAHLEHGIPLLAKLELPKLLDAYGRLQEDERDTQAMSDLVKVIAGAAEARVLRKLSAVYRATTEALVSSEFSPEVLAKLEAEAAARPFLESVEDVMAFFFSLGLSVPTIPSSSGEATQGSSEKEGVAIPANSL